jgi:hypothetical protein
MRNAAQQAQASGLFLKTAVVLWVVALCGAFLALPYVATLEHKALAAAAVRTHLEVRELLAISVTQTAVLLAIAAVAGQWAARKLGLGTPLIAAFLTRRPAPERTPSTLSIAFALGTATALALIILDHWVFAPNPSVAELIRNAETGSAKPSAWQGLLASFYGALDEDELLAIAFKHPPVFAPGTEYDYCNTNYALLGLIAEKVEGAPLARIFQDRLFGPLGMKDTLLPASTSNTIPAPYAHGYLYGSSSYALADAPYPADLIAAARAGTLKPNDDTGQNPSYALAAGGVISTADDLATWMRALVGGKILDADYQRQWLDSPEPEDPSKPLGQKYGYGIAQMTFGPNSLYFHGGEMPGYNSFMGYDQVNDIMLIVWTNLTISLDGQLPANSIMLKMLDRIYTVSPLQQRQ